MTVVPVVRRLHRIARRAALPCLVFAVPCAVYLRTMAPTVYGQDSAELTTGAFTLGIVHSPGYPLYLLLGRLFCCLPYGDVGWRVNLLSVLSASLAVLVVYSLALRVTGRRWLAVLTAWLLAFSYYFWVWALVAEVYALHACLAAALLRLTLHWRDTHRRGVLWGAGLLFGLGLGNHVALVLLAPALAWLVLTDASRPWQRPGLLAGTVGAAALGCAAIYLYLPLRHAARPALDCMRDYFPDVDLASWQGIAWMISGRMFAPLIFGVPPASLGEHALRFGAQLIRNFGVLAALAAVVGIVVELRASPCRRAVMIGLLLAFALHTAFFISYAARDKEWMYSVAYVAWSLCAGAGVAAAVRFGRASPRRRHVLAALCSLVVARLVWFNFPLVDLHADRSARRTGERIMQAVEPNAAVFGGFEYITLLEYLQHVEQVRPDVRLVNTSFLSARTAPLRLAELHREGRPLYTTVTNMVRSSLSLRNVPGTHCYKIVTSEAR